jgi:rod shape-determining protein MreC
MRFTHRNIATTRTAAHAPAARISLVLLLVASLALVWAERQQKHSIDQLRANALDALLPVVEVMNRPLESLHNLNDRVNQFFAVYQENENLRLENARLRQWQATALKLESDNNALRELLHYQPGATQHFISAKVVGGADLSASQHIHINAGRAEGVERWQAVMNAYGLIGRVIHVSEHHAEVLLLNDANSRIPVRLEPSGVKAILAGTQGGVPRIELTQHNRAPQPGDTVLSADDGKVLPDGILIGRLEGSAQDGWEVRLASEQSSLHFVRVVDLTR